VNQLFLPPPFEYLMYYVTLLWVEVGQPWYTQTEFTLDAVYLSVHFLQGLIINTLSDAPL
jgi:hypothetical protein